MIQEIVRSCYINLTKLEIIEAKEHSEDYEVTIFLAGAMEHCKKLKQLILTHVEPGKMLIICLHQLFQCCQI